MKQDIRAQVIADELKVVVNREVAAIVDDLSNDCTLPFDEFKSKFYCTLAEKMRELDKSPVLSPKIFSIEDKLEALGWKKIPASHLPEFHAYVDYANKTYINMIPRAYYALMFLERLWENLQEEPLTEGIYHYTFGKGERRHYEENSQTHHYYHEFLQVAEVDAMPETKVAEPVGMTLSGT